VAVEPSRPPAAGRWRRAPAIAAVVVLAGAVPFVAWEIAGHDDGRRERLAKPDPRYATQRGTPAGARRANIAQRADEVVEGALETCAGLGVATMAARYGLPPDPVLVARRLAGTYEAAYRPRAFAGCLAGLRHGG
jgi:hypothetical protein